jgi:hypothetical protein
MVSTEVKTAVPARVMPAEALSRAECKATVACASSCKQDVEPILRESDRITALQQLLHLQAGMGGSAGIGHVLAHVAIH